MKQLKRVLLASLDNSDVMTRTVTEICQKDGLQVEILSSPYGRFFTDVIDPQNLPDFIVLWLSGLGATSGNLKPIDLEPSLVVRKLAQYVKYGVQPIVILPETSERELDPFSDFTTSRLQFNGALLKELGNIALVINPDAALLDKAEASWGSIRYWELGRYSRHPFFVDAIAKLVGTSISRLVQPHVKAIVTDLDDTLWGGIVGDDGVSGVLLDIDAGGRPFLEMQSLLKELRHRGIFLGVASKNEPELAKRVFDERSEMILKFSDFVYFGASWQPKATAIKEFASMVNVDMTSVCFLDDSPFERSQAKGILPGLVVPELPANPLERPIFLNREHIFLLPKVSEEDRNRVLLNPLPPQEMEGHSDADLDAFYEGLQMSVIFEPITQDTIERAVSLLSRTNQFNLNQYRPSLLELKATLPLHENSFVVRYSDKDSPPTVIAVVLASIRGRYLYLKNWVMSCRVFGRGVEWATASHLKTLMLALDATALVVDFCQTERNAPAYDALRQLAFEEINIGEDLNLPTSGRVLASHLELVPESRITVSNTRTGP